MERILEPEVMDDPVEAWEYDQMDFQAVNQAFVQETLTLAPPQAQILDVGTGTARIPLLLLQHRPTWQIIGIDLAASMLAIGRSQVQARGLGEKIRLEKVDAKEIPYPDYSFDLVVSNSLIHHLPDPVPFFQELKRVLKPQGNFFLRDLLRPATPAEVEALVDEHGHAYSPRQRQLFEDSLRAAFTLEEIEALCRAAHLPVTVYQSSPLHWSAKKPNRG